MTAAGELVAPLTYVGNTDTYVVPSGFKTDFASVPKIFWPLFPPSSRRTAAAVLHDWFYAGGGVITRKDADGIFRRTMREAGISWWRRWTMYRAVRICGWSRWRK